MAGQRTWHRVEVPGTFRGHAVEATIGGNHWRGWENPDGTWSLSMNGSDPVTKRDWTDVRTSAERPVQNPMNPMLAGAAAAGMAIAMRDHLINNPGVMSWEESRGPWGSGNYNRAMSDPLAVTSPMLPAMAPLPGVSPHSSKFSRHRAVVDSLGGMPVVRGPRADRYGNVWIMVGRGYGRVARRAVRRARFRFPVQVMEAA